MSYKGLQRCEDLFRRTLKYLPNVITYESNPNGDCDYPYHRGQYDFWIGDTKYIHLRAYYFYEDDTTYLCVGYGEIRVNSPEGQWFRIEEWSKLKGLFYEEIDKQTDHTYIINKP